MSALKKLETGVPGLDILTLGGIPEGRSTLIAGKSGTGKTVVSLQVAGNLARQGIKTVVVAVEETPQDLQDSGDNLGLGISAVVRSGMLHFADLTRPMDGPTMISGDYDLFGLVHRLEALVKQTGARALVLDSATALFSPRPPAETLRSHFFQLLSALRAMKLTSVIIAESADDYGQLTTLGVEDYVCDLTIVLRNVIDGGRRRRSIEVNKYRRSAHYKGEFPCTITTRGLAVFPLDAKEHPDDQVERYSSGVGGLDEMTHGGWLRNSIIIVRGPTGSGKTMLAGLYARAGASRGERVVYYGFEETRPILLREREPQGDLPLPRGHQPRGSARRSAARARGAQALADRAGQHLLDRTRLVGERIPAVHDRRCVHSAGTRPECVDHADDRVNRDGAAYGAVPVDDS
jgi:circadian clock protein KaiC